MGRLRSQLIRVMASTEKERHRRTGGAGDSGRNIEQVVGVLQAKKAIARVVRDVSKAHPPPVSQGHNFGGDPDREFMVSVASFSALLGAAYIGQIDYDVSAKTPTQKRFHRRAKYTQQLPGSLIASEF
jgi:hypothetical protein